jgi:aerobic-type carbon monoxide dehydrogenase small subunit (CoxS/CutS family)
MPERVRKLNVNGREMRVDAAPEESLLSVLREQLDLTGTKYGCGEGQCGACTVLVNGIATRSCLAAVQAVAGKRVTTVEGLEQNGKLHPVQQAFLDTGAFQCGFCTPGMVVAAAGLLRKNSNPSDSEIRQGMNGNVCRCGTYPRIVAAVRRAAEMKAEVSSGE